MSNSNAFTFLTANRKERKYFGIKMVHFEIKTRWPKALELRVAKSSQICSKAANVEFVIDLIVLTTSGRKYP